MNGKQKCKMLKEIRQRIADENDIPYVTRECRFQGACRGTCPRCESELRYLERELAKRRSMKKRVTVAALCAGMVIASAGCSSSSPVAGNDQGGAVPYENSEYTSEKNATGDTGSTDENSTGDTGSTDENSTGDTGSTDANSTGNIDSNDRKDSKGTGSTDGTGSDDLVEETGEVPYPEDYNGTEYNQDTQGSKGDKGNVVDDKTDSTEVFVTTGEVPYPEENYGS